MESWYITRKHLRGLLRTIIYRIRSRYLQFLEMLNNDEPNIIEKKIQIDNLPGVKLIPVKEEKEIESLVKFYYKNPSPMVLAPWKREEIKAKILNGIEFYLCYNKENKLVGAIGFDCNRNMFVHFIIDYKNRGKGYGMKMSFELLDLKKRKGIHEFRAQTFNNNNRVINTMKKIGFEIDSKECGEEYITLVKTFR